MKWTVAKLTLKDAEVGGQINVKDYVAPYFGMSD